MPTTNVRTLAQIRQDIKIEGRVDGTDDLDAWIDSLVNELLTSAIENRRYFELLVLNTEIPTEEGVSVYSLPANFCAMKQVGYKRGQSPTYTLHERGHFVEFPAGRSARYWQVQGGNLIITPFRDVPNDDTLVFDYYKYPDVLTSSSNFPIPKLIASVKQKAVSRVMKRDRDNETARVLAAEGASNESRGRTTSSSG